jgi:hypothetical protein
MTKTSPGGRSQIHLVRISKRYTSRNVSRSSVAPVPSVFLPLKLLISIPYKSQHAVSSLRSPPTQDEDPLQSNPIALVPNRSSLTNSASS